MGLPQKFTFLQQARFLWQILPLSSIDFPHNHTKENCV